MKEQTLMLQRLIYFISSCIFLNYRRTRRFCHICFYGTSLRAAIGFNMDA